MFFFEITAGYYIIPYLKLKVCVLELPTLLSLLECQIQLHSSYRHTLLCDKLLILHIN